jgi:hypothetical protein
MSMPSPLDALCGPSGPLQPELPDAAEFAGLVKSGVTRLVDAERCENALESRFDLAYNAAHRHAGYRSSKRYIVFQVLPHTLGLGPEVWRVLDRAHNERNRSEYEGDLTVDDRLLADVIRACHSVVTAVRRLPPL